MDNKLIDFTPLGEELVERHDPIDEEDRLEQPVRFFDNPFYDKVFMLMLNVQVRTNQSRERVHLVKYKEIVRQLITKVRLDARFPYAGDMLLHLHFHGSLEQIKKMDVDNMAKPLIDCMKKIILSDDNRVRMLWVEKSPHNSPGCKVGIKFLHTGQMPILMPPLHFNEAEMSEMLASQGLTLSDLGKGVA